jgi:hypothetical protein
MSGALRSPADARLSDNLLLTRKSFSPTRLRECRVGRRELANPAAVDTAGAREISIKASAVAGGDC